MGNRKSASQILVSSFRDDKKVMRYHLECESNPGRSIIVRIFEYDAQIALNDREQEGYRLKVNFPHTAVIALRASGKMPESMECGD